MSYDDFIAALSDIAVKKYGSVLAPVDAFRKIVNEVGWTCRASIACCAPLLHASARVVRVTRGGRVVVSLGRRTCCRSSIASLSTARTCRWRRIASRRRKWCVAVHRVV
jgi:hypothetical protein